MANISDGKGRESGGDVLHVALGILHAQDQHMLSHPAFLAEELLTAALNEAKKNVSAKAMYWFTEDERETQLAKRFGAKKFTDYKAFCLYI